MVIKMRMRRGIVGIVVILILITSIWVAMSVERSGDIVDGNRARGTYVPHKPIRINSNSDFNPGHGVVGGTGTEDDPYVIRGWKIEASIGIYVGNTSAYFVIEDCYIFNSSGLLWRGIEFYNVENGTIRYTTIIGPEGGNAVGHGVYITGSKYIKIEKIYVKTYWFGIYMEFSRKIWVGNSTIYAGGTDVELENGAGIELQSVNNSTIYGNTIEIYGSPYVIWIGEYYATISADNNLIKENFINGHSKSAGIRMRSGNRGYFNVISYTKYEGIKAREENIFLGNSFYYNNGTGDWYDTMTGSQARQYGANTWSVYYGPWIGGRGNYWRDWANNNNTNDQDNDGIVDYPYTIGGNRSTRDEYPFKYHIPAPPQNLTAKIGTGYVNLSWEAPVGDGGKDITSYKIYCNGTEIATVPATQLYYNHSNIVQEGRYEYYVVAVNEKGESINSNWVIADVEAAIPELTHVGILILISTVFIMSVTMRYRKK